MKRSKLIYLAGALLIGCGSLAAAPLTPEQARKEFIDMQANGESSLNKVRRSSALTADELTLAYTAVKDHTGCFYVYNIKGGGSIFITADDRLPALLGYTSEGAFDADQIPENMKWWLSEYETQIADYLATDPRVPKSVRYASADDREAIAPMVKSKWNQTAPYNNMCPIDNRTGQRSVTGCVATAMAQIMNYHQWPVHPTGSANGYIFTDTTLDWANMLDVYENNAWSAAQGNAVALLMRQCGAGVNMMYSSWASGAYSFDVPEALVKYFDYNPSMQIHYREYYNQRQWNDMVYNELAAARPVYYSGNSNEGGHAFVCDGYDANDFFHFNWGWGGYEDGYFRLNALNPGTGGTGSSAGGYNAGQSIITGWKKAAGETNRQQLLVSTGNFTYDKDDTYVIRGGGQYNIIYNPLAYSQTFNFGLKVTPWDGGTPTYVKASAKTTLASMYGNSQFKLKLPTLSNGKYKVAPAMYNCYNEWQDIPVPYGMQSYVTLTVAGGQKTFSNDGAPEETISKLIPSFPEFVNPIHAEDALAFNMTISNVGKGDFYNSLILTLYSSDGIGKDAEIYNSASILGKGSTDIKFSTGASVDEGEYELSLYSPDLTLLYGPQTIQVLPAHNNGVPEGDLIIESISPLFPTSGENVGISLSVTNNATKELQCTFVIRLLRASDLKEIKKYTASSPYIFPASETQLLNFAPGIFEVPAGEYYWECSDTNGKMLSRLTPVKVYGKTIISDGVTYVVTDEASKTAMVTATDGERTDVKIPASIQGYKVTELRPDVFTFNKNVKRVELPAEIKTIPAGEFYDASELEFLTMKSTTPPALHENAFAEGATEKVTISGPEGGYTNIYHSDAAWGDFPMCSWDIIWPDDVVVDSGMLRDADGKIYDPYYIGAFEPLHFFFTLPTDYRLIATFNIGDGEEEEGSFKGEAWLPALSGKDGKVKFTSLDCAAVEGIVAENGKCNVYSLQGILILRDADADAISKLPKGIYIISGKKIKI